MSTIFLVDDHAMMRDGLRAVLVAAGHRIAGEAADPPAALDAIVALAPELVLLDLHLGAHSGLTLLAELQRRQAPVRTIVLSMSAQPRHVAEALRLGAAGYVLKGASAAELTQAIEVVLRGEAYLSDEVSTLALQGATAHADDGEAFETLSARERQIVGLVVRGQSSSEIGALLHLSPKTVDSYRSRLMAKLGVADVTALVRLAIRVGLIEADER